MATRMLQGRTLGFTLAIIFFIVILSNRHTFLPVPYSSQRLTTSLPPKPLTARQRMARSEKAWKTSVKLRHQMATSHPSYPQIPLFPAQTLDMFGKYPYTLWDFFPATYTCPHDIQRIGRLGDGGKWVCGMSLYESRPGLPSASKSTNTRGKGVSAQPTIIYSFGINGESSFEAEMLSRIPSSQIFGYDFSVSGFGAQIADEHRARTQFGKVGLGAVDDVGQSPPFYTLDTLMKRNNHTYIDILKIDIEGAEYEALDAFMDSLDAERQKVLPVGQVMIELHLSDDKKTGFGRFMKWWERLEGLGMRPTWLEVNLMAVTLGRGKTDPRCVEYVWVNGLDSRNILLQD